MTALDDTGLRALLAHLRDDPSALDAFAAGYRGETDPLDVLRWRVDPAAADHPRHEARALQLVVYARPADARAHVARDAAARRLAALVDDADDRALDDAVVAYLSPPRPAARPVPPWFARPPVWLAVGAAVGAIGIALALAPRAPVDDPLVQSASVFDRGQQPAERRMGDRLAPGLDPASVRVLLERPALQVYAALVDAEANPGASAPGDVCLVVRSGSEGDRATALNCVSPQRFDRGGIWIDAVDGVDTGFSWVAWGPVGTSVRLGPTG